MPTPTQSHTPLLLLYVTETFTSKGKVAYSVSLNWESRERSLPLRVNPPKTGTFDDLNGKPPSHTHLCQSHLLEIYNPTRSPWK
mmetsp:Transcript_39061/g.34748  ORF Transcript_39061/g.34748 Transcript_39061/m.34748 type:complete len:84 (-) Transcript_39061:925-1176(-)